MKAATADGKRGPKNRSSVVVETSVTPRGQDLGDTERTGRR
jgi:hypothetical protein